MSNSIINYSSILKIFGFSAPANEKMLSIIILYIEMMSILFSIALVVGFIVIFCIYFFNHTRNNVSFFFSKKVESLLYTFFALIPTVIISYLLIPALGFLFQIEYDENLLETLFNVHIIGHQWYWTYEVDTKIGSDLLICFYDSNFSFPILQFDSYMDRENDINRLLSVDKSLVLPSGYNISFYITSHDVIHSWAVPQLGIKADALPGRLMKFILYASMEGTFYGQCSELCGVNHAFMPICVEIIKSKHFLDWILLSLSCNISKDIAESFDVDIDELIKKNYFKKKYYLNEKLLACEAVENPIVSFYKNNKNNNISILDEYLNKHEGTRTKKMVSNFILNNKINK